MNFIEVFKALGDENRIRIFHLLTKQDLCVCEIETILEMTQSNVSRHLSGLKNARVIICKKKSQWAIYQINPEFRENNQLLYQFLVDSMAKNLELAVDEKKLERYQHSSYNCETITKDKDKVIKCVQGIE